MAQRYVKRVEPEAPYLSPAYGAALRKRYLEILREHPGYVARVTARKSAFKFVDGIQHFPLAIVIGPVLLVLAASRRRLRQALILMAPLAVVAFLPALIAVPRLEYELPWLAMLALLTVVGLCYGLAWLGRARPCSRVPTPQIAEAVAPALRAYEQVGLRTRAAFDAMQRLASRALAVPASILRATGAAVRSRASRASAVPSACPWCDRGRCRTLAGGWPLDGPGLSWLTAQRRRPRRDIGARRRRLCSLRHASARQGRRRVPLLLASTSPVRPFDTTLPPALESWRFSGLPRRVEAGFRSRARASSRAGRGST